MNTTENNSLLNIIKTYRQYRLRRAQVPIAETSNPSIEGKVGWKGGNILHAITMPYSGKIPGKFLRPCVSHDENARLQFPTRARATWTRVSPCFNMQITRINWDPPRNGAQDTYSPSAKCEGRPPYFARGREYKRARVLAVSASLLAAQEMQLHVGSGNFQLY